MAGFNHMKEKYINWLCLGLATAAGCQLVASCDLAVAATNTHFATPG